MLFSALFFLFPDRPVPAVRTDLQARGLPLHAQGCCSCKSKKESSQEPQSWPKPERNLIVTICKSIVEMNSTITAWLETRRQSLSSSCIRSLFTHGCWQTATDIATCYNSSMPKNDVIQKAVLAVVGMRLPEVWVDQAREGTWCSRVAQDPLSEPVHGYVKPEEKKQQKQELVQVKHQLV